MEGFIFALAAIGALCLIGLALLALWTWLAGTEEEEETETVEQPYDYEAAMVRLQQIGRDSLADAAAYRIWAEILRERKSR